MRQDRPRRRPPQWPRARPPGSLPQWASAAGKALVSIGRMQTRVARLAAPSDARRRPGPAPTHGEPGPPIDTSNLSPADVAGLQATAGNQAAVEAVQRAAATPAALGARTPPRSIVRGGAAGRPARAVDQRGGADRAAAPQRDGRMGHRRGSDLRRAERAHAHRLPGDQGGLRAGLRPQGPRRRARGRAERLRDGAGPGRPRVDARHGRADGGGAGRRAGRAGAADRPAADRRDARLGHRRDADLQRPRGPLPERGRRDPAPVLRHDRPLARARHPGRDERVGARSRAAAHQRGQLRLVPQRVLGVPRGGPPCRRRGHLGLGDRERQLHGPRGRGVQARRRRPLRPVQVAGPDRRHLEPVRAHHEHRLRVPDPVRPEGSVPGRADRARHPERPARRLPGP